MQHSVVLDLGKTTSVTSRDLECSVVLDLGETLSIIANDL